MMRDDQRRIFSPVAQAKPAASTYFINDAVDLFPPPSQLFLTSSDFGYNAFCMYCFVFSKIE